MSCMTSWSLKCTDLVSGQFGLDVVFGVVFVVVDVVELTLVGGFGIALLPDS